MIEFFVCVILTELLTELVIKSEIFMPVRLLIFKLGDWFTKLFSCGYCFSVWAAMGVVLLTNTMYNLTGIYLLDFTLTALVVHRSANITHNIIDKYTDKYYDTRYVSTVKE